MRFRRGRTRPRAIAWFFEKPLPRRETLNPVTSEFPVLAWATFVIGQVDPVGKSHPVLVDRFRWRPRAPST